MLTAWISRFVSVHCVGVIIIRDYESRCREPGHNERLSKLDSVPVCTSYACGATFGARDGSRRGGMRKNLIRLTALFALVVVTFESAAGGSFYTGNEMMTLCKDTNIGESKVSIQRYNGSLVSG